MIMELWEILDKRWKAAKAANGYDEDEVQHQAYLKASEEEKEAARKSLAEYDPEEHAYNGPLNDEWVSAGVAHSIDFKEINEDFYHPDWVRGYDI